MFLKSYFGRQFCSWSIGKLSVEPRLPFIITGIKIYLLCPTKAPFFFPHNSFRAKNRDFVWTEVSKSTRSHRQSSCCSKRKQIIFSTNFVLPAFGRGNSVNLFFSTKVNRNSPHRQIPLGPLVSFVFLHLFPAILVENTTEQVVRD